MSNLGFDKSINNVFSEEQENLNNNVQKIDFKIKKLNTEVKKYFNDCNEYRGDYEYLNEYNRCQKHYNEALKELNQTEAVSFNPYFGHMYLESNENDEDIFVGEKSISTIDGKNIVYDWRSPVCSLFYAKQNSIKYNNYNFVAKYKRQLEIKDKKLINCYETYNKENNEVTDEFLKEVLKSKKNGSGFTDIIKTIQSKQNEIIRLDLNKNIICQGVAGSGKTVIMVHRLSYLLFNNKNISPNNFLFIAPSDNFKGELNSLNTKLGIGQIKLLTICDYYMEKFNTYLNMFMNDKYYVKEIVDDENIEIKQDYSKESLLKKFEIIKSIFLKEVNKIIDKYNIKTTKNNQTYFNISKQVNDFLKERIKKYTDQKKILKDNLNILNDYIKKYENLNIEEESNKSDFKIENIDKYEIELNRLELHNAKIDKSIFKFLERNTYKKNLLEIKKLNKIINVYHVYTLRKKTTSLTKYVAISDAFKIKINNFLIKLEKCLNNNNNIFEEIDQIMTNIININKNLEKLSEFNYEEDCLNLNKLRDFVIPRNIIKACFENICVGNYKLNTVFSTKKYYRNDVFSIIYILVSMGFKLSNQYKYIYIDEVQDYNDVEIELVKKLENDSIFSVFGDFDQNISHNSIIRQNWNGIKKLFDNNYNYYELNENYRNTTNVVEYCNEKLKTNMLGIGVSGENVKVNKFVGIDEIIKRAKITDSIIITKNKKYLEYINDKSTITCFDIKSVKGLEFKNVIVIDDGLTKNEKYVSFTRSLGNLEIYII